MYTMTSRGFTLIEIMIVVALVAIIAAIAYPTYQNSVLKSRRADAKSVLLQAANWLERFYTVNNRYDQNLAGIAVTAATQFPSSGLTQAPVEGATKYYNITLTGVTQNSFALSAVPIATTGQDKDACKTLTLTQTGAKGVTGGATLTADDCWR
jgi:type IV pilus assembly protein PilE